VIRHPRWTQEISKTLKSFSSLGEYSSAENKSFRIVFIRCKDHCMKVQRDISK
jgi:hypothetical protein